MNLKEIREMISLMNDNDLIEIEVERSGSKVKLKKASAQEFVSLHREPVKYNAVGEHSNTSTELSASEKNSNRKQIKSPMVGTFYRAPSPDAAPYVESGQSIEVGQVVCIVEAMKLMNEIKSEIKGKIVEICVENAQPVEFEQTLFYVE